MIVRIVAFLLLAVPTSANASGLRRVVANADAFASDGTRYVAWDVVGPRPETVVLDTSTGHMRKIGGVCGLEDRAPAAAARFLLDCGHEQQALLDVKTGKTTLLPKPPPHEYGEYGPIWTGVGLHYVIGKAGLHSRCHRPKRHESCTALYDIATGTMSKVPESRVPDPDSPGASPLCRALRSSVFSRSQFETLEGLGPLAPLTAGFGYREGPLCSPGTDR